MGKTSENPQQLWDSLSNEDSKSKLATEVLMVSFFFFCWTFGYGLIQAVDKVCKDLGTFMIPHDDKMKMMIELPEKFPFVDIKLFASYWKWYAEIAIKCGLPQEKIIAIIQEVF